VVALADEHPDKIRSVIRELNEDGFRVIAVAYREVSATKAVYSLKDESDLILVGYIAFLDPPKESALNALCCSSARSARCSTTSASLCSCTASMAGRTQVCSKLAGLWNHCCHGNTHHDPPAWTVAAGVALRARVGLSPAPREYLVALVAILAGYLLLTQVVKTQLIKRFGL